VLSERPEFPLDGLLEIDESYYGGRGKPESRGRRLTDRTKSLIAIAVERSQPRRARARASRRAALSPACPHRRPAGATAAHLAICSAARPARRPLITDGLKSYDALADSFRHYSIVQDGAKTPIACCPSSTPVQQREDLGSTALSTASAPSTCRATRASGTTASIATAYRDLTGLPASASRTRQTITYRRSSDGAQSTEPLPALTG